MFNIPYEYHLMPRWWDWSHVTFSTGLRVWNGCLACSFMNYINYAISLHKERQLTLMQISEVFLSKLDVQIIALRWLLEMYQTFFLKRYMSMYSAVNQKQTFHCNNHTQTNLDWVNLICSYENVWHPNKRHADTLQATPSAWPSCYLSSPLHLHLHLAQVRPPGTALRLPGPGGHMALLPPSPLAPQESVQVRAQDPPQLPEPLWHGGRVRPPHRDHG